MQDATAILSQFYVRHVWPAAKYELRQFISIATVVSTLLGTIACHVVDQVWGREGAFLDAVPTLLGLVIASLCYAILKAALIAPTKVAMQYHADANDWREKHDVLSTAVVNTMAYDAALRMFDSVEEALIAWSNAIREPARKTPVGRWQPPSIRDIKRALDGCMEQRREEFPEIFEELWPAASRPWLRVPDGELVEAMSFFQGSVGRARQRFIRSREHMRLLAASSEFDTMRN